MGGTRSSHGVRVPACGCGGDPARMRLAPPGIQWVRGVRVPDCCRRLVSVAAGPTRDGMHTLPTAQLALLATLALAIAAVGQTPSGARGAPDPGTTTTAKQPAAPAIHLLTPAEEAIADSPCPSDAAARTLVHELLRHRETRRQQLTLPPEQRPKLPDNGGMGWNKPDAEYWTNVPPEVKAIPSDWSALPGVRFLNTQVDGVRDVRLCERGDYDLWLLTDPLHEITACIGVHRPTRRVWFLEIARTAEGGWVPKRSKDPCYACHTSGPRIIRPLAENGVDSAMLERLNRRMLSYGACDFGDSVDPATRGPARDDARCAGCHDGVDRGRLFAIHDRVIKFKSEVEATMPPPASAAFRPPGASSTATHGSRLTPPARMSPG